MSDPDLIPCNPPGYIKDVITDQPPPYCRDTDKQTSLKDVPGRDFSWLEEDTMKKTGIGQNALCDPMLKGHIINDQDGGAGTSAPNRNTIYKYSKAIRGCDEGVQDMFRDIIVIDENHKAHNIPIIWATQEKAVAAIIQENFRKDNSLVVDRIRLPMLAIHASDIQFQPNRYCYHKAVDYLRDLRRDNAPGFTTKERYERDTVFGVAKGIPLDIQYTLFAWTLHREDMNQIVEQIVQKLTPMGYIRVKGVSWEIGVKLESIGNNIELEPGDQAINVFKYQFTMTAETYMPQPIIRKKAVLKTRTEIVDTISDDELTEVVTRLEQAVKELQ